MQELNTKRINNIVNKIENKKSKPIKDNKKKHTSTQEYVKQIRKLNENLNQENRKTIYDQEREEKKFRNILDDLNVIIKFDELKVYDSYVFWSGIIDGVIQFTFEVTPYEDTSGINFDYTDDFNSDNPDNEEIIERVENYYNEFYKYWRDNLLQT